MTKEIVKPVFIRKKLKGLAVSPPVKDKVNSYQYKDGNTQDLLFDMSKDSIKDGRNKLRFEVGRT